MEVCRLLRRSFLSVEKWTKCPRTDANACSCDLRTSCKTSSVHSGEQLGSCRQALPCYTFVRPELMSEGELKEWGTGAHTPSSTPPLAKPWPGPCPGSDDDQASHMQVITPGAEQCVRAMHSDCHLCRFFSCLFSFFAGIHWKWLHVPFLGHPSVGNNCTKLYSIKFLPFCGQWPLSSIV